MPLRGAALRNPGSCFQFTGWVRSLGDQLQVRRNQHDGKARNRCTEQLAAAPGILWSGHQNTHAEYMQRQQNLNSEQRMIGNGVSGFGQIVENPGHYQAGDRCENDGAEMGSRALIERGSGVRRKSRGRWNHYKSGVDYAAD